MEQISCLLANHSQVLGSFNSFLPSGHRIEKLPGSLSAYRRCHDNPKAVTEVRICLPPPLPPRPYVLNTYEAAWQPAYRRCHVNPKAVTEVRICLPPPPRLGLNKIFFYLAAFAHESTVFYCLPPICIAHTSAILLHDYCAIYDTPSTPLLYAIHRTILVMAISCKGQPQTLPPHMYRLRMTVNTTGTLMHAAIKISLCCCRACWVYPKVRSPPHIHVYMYIYLYRYV